MAKKRNYKKEYRTYHKRAKQKKRRACRNGSRRMMIKSKRARKGDGKDVDHKDRNPCNKSRKNLRIRSKKKNRGRNK